MLDSTRDERTVPGAPAPVRRLPHGRIGIALHRLSSEWPESPEPDPAEGRPPLLLLHALGASAQAWRAEPPAWPGAVHALDFAGHGASDPVRGGGYSPEYFLGDADRALGAIGDRAVVAGRGIGAYVAMLLAGARPDRVPAALLLPGAGIEGGGARPGTDRWTILSLEAWEARIATDSAAYAAGTDPAVSLADHEYRPDAYVAGFAQAARRLLLCTEGADPGRMPGWWRVAAQAPAARVLEGDMTAAFAALADASPATTGPS